MSCSLRAVGWYAVGCCWYDVGMTWFVRCTMYNKPSIVFVDKNGRRTMRRPTLKQHQLQGCLDYDNEHTNKREQRWLQTAAPNSAKRAMENIREPCDEAATPASAPTKRTMATARLYYTIQKQRRPDFGHWLSTRTTADMHPYVVHILPIYNLLPTSYQHCADRRLTPRQHHTTFLE